MRGAGARGRNTSERTLRPSSVAVDFECFRQNFKAQAGTLYVHYWSPC